jgi:hypothetical protein
MLSAPDKSLGVEIYNALGQQVKAAAFSDVEKSVQVNLSSLPAGYYFARIKDAAGNIAVRKFVKN